MTTSVAQEQTSFELERFRWSDPERLEVQGRWFGVRGRRFVRPVLTVTVDGRRRRLLAMLEHKPWTADEGERWVAAFPWEGSHEAVGEAELEVGSLTVDLPPPSGVGRRKRKFEKPKDTAAATPEPPPATEVEPPPAPEDVVRMPAGEARGVLERDLAGARAELGRIRQRHEEEIRELRSEARRATERMDWAETEVARAAAAAEEARAEVEQLRAELEAERAERDLLREESERHRAAVEAATAEAEKLRESSTAADRLREVARRAVAEAESQREVAEASAEEADRLRTTAEDAAGENERLRQTARKAAAEAERLRAATRRPGAAPARPPVEAAGEETRGDDADQPAAVDEARPADPEATMPFDVVPADEEPAAEGDRPAAEADRAAAEPPREEEDAAADIAAAGPIDQLRGGAAEELPPMEPGQTVRRIPRQRQGSAAQPSPPARPAAPGQPRRIRPEPGAGAARLLGEPPPYTLERRTPLQVWGPRIVAVVLVVLLLIALALIVRGVI